MAGKKQTLTIHAKSVKDLEKVMDFLTNAFADYKDSGDAPELIFYDQGEVQRSDVEFE